MVSRPSRRTTTRALVLVLALGAAGALRVFTAGGPTTSPVITGHESAGSSVVPPTVPAALPEAPTGLKATTGSGTVHLEWQKPVEHGSAVTNHSVVITPQHAANQTTPDGNTRTADFKGLTNGTTYTFTVVAHSSVGDTAPVSMRATPQAAPLLTCGVLDKVQGAPAGSPGLDTESVVSASAAQQMAAAGETFVIRYVSLQDVEQPGDLTRLEVVGIMEAGLAIMPVQHAEAPGWIPSGTLGAQDGRSAAIHATETGFACGVNVWLDLDAVSPGTDAQSISAYVNSWAAEVSAAGFVPGLYVGANSGLDAEQLAALNVEHFWRSASAVPAIAVGYQLVQSPPTSGFGLAYQPDVTQSDDQDGVVLWFTT